MASALSTPSISIVNLKGGVGKTALSVNLAFALAEWHAKRVLLVDIDPQFNATQHLLQEQVIVDNLSGRTVKDILDPPNPSVHTGRTPKRKRPAADEYIQNVPVIGNGSIDLLPSLLDLSFVNRNPSGKEGRLEQFLHKIESKYDVILIDCPPTISVLSMAAFNSSKYYVVPVTPDYFAPIGIPLLEEEVDYYLENLHSETGTMIPLGIVFTIVDNRWHADWGSISRRVSAKTDIPIFNTHFSYSKYWRDCAFTHQPVYRGLPPTSTPASELRKFTIEFLEKLNMAEEGSGT